MRPITEGRTRGSLTAAKVKGTVFICLICERSELGVAMRAITEGLVCAFSTRAPKVLFARCHVDRERCLLCDVGFGHGFTPRLVEIGCAVSIATLVCCA